MNNFNNLNVSDFNNLNVSAVYDAVFGTPAPPPAGAACAAALSTRMSNDRNNQLCYTETGYSFNYLEPAEVNDLPFICNSAPCKAMVDLARSIATDECVVDDEYYLYKDILNPIIRKCANVTTTAPTINATRTPSATGEAALSGDWTVVTKTPAPTTRWVSSFKDGSDKDGSIIIWITAFAFVGIVIAGVVSFCNQKAKRNPNVQRNQHLVYGHEDIEPAPDAPSVYVRIDAHEDRIRKSNAQPSPARRSDAKQQSASTKSATQPSPARRSGSRPSAPTKSTTSTASTSSSNSIHSLDPSKFPLLQDQQIIAVRVPYEKIVLAASINRGGYGEVHKGTYKDEDVAIKKMLPEHRQDTRLINKFLDEIKLMSSLEHERIVRFVGVAWDAVSDLCVLTEFMAGGDLRSLLQRYEAERRPDGFDRNKIKIALHVAHALTYMHSLQPVVLHRDLKSSNILLSQDMDAKITDFGVSRERADATMTRGVGTSLWMAPEILMGGRYDEKADVFSFGVVLSELDSNKLPYANQVDLSNSRTNFADISQSVAQGRLAVDFSYESDPDIVALGRDCVSVDPLDRPTAAEALHRVHQVLRQY